MEKKKKNNRKPSSTTAFLLHHKIELSSLVLILIGTFFLIEDMNIRRAVSGAFGGMFKDINDFIIITFLDQRRPPITLLVWRIGHKAPKVETLSGTFSIDTDGRHRTAGAAATPTPAPPAQPNAPTAQEGGTPEG